MANDEIMMMGEDITDLTGKQQGALFETSGDSILILARKADEYIEALNKIMTAALKITTENDWVLIGGQPYLQESGATKVARLFGISIQLIGNPLVETDGEGYKTYTYKARFMFQGQFIDCEGSRSMREDFFSKQGKDKPKKKPDEIDERDVKMAAYTNCLNNGIKRLIPNLRNLDVSTLEAAGMDVKRIKGYTFKSGGNGGNSGKADESGLACAECGEAVTQTVASYSQAKYGKILCMKCQKKQGGGKQE